MIGAGEVSGVGQDFGEHAGNGGVIGVGVVELLDQRQGFSLVLCGEDGGELGGEGGVVGGLLEGGAEEGFRFGILLFSDEQMGEAGVGRGGFGVLGKDAAIGGFGGGGFTGLVGEVGGEDGIVGGFRGELEGLKQVAGGLGGVGGAVDLSQGAPCAGFQGGAGVTGVEGGGCGEFAAGFGQPGCGV